MKNFIYGCSLFVMCCAVALSATPSQDDYKPSLRPCFVKVNDYEYVNFNAINRISIVTPTGEKQ